MRSILNSLRVFRDKLIVRFYGFPMLYSLVCTDITNKCNLKCKGCYHIDENNTKARELTVEEWKKLYLAVKKKHRFVNYAAWVGGEPLCRQDALRELTKIFPHNMIVTNGTLPIPELDNSIFIVSVDGTQEFDDERRGRGHFAKALKNIRESPVRVSINMMITRQNYVCLDRFIEFWRKEPNVRRIYLSFYTPTIGEGDELWTGWELRDLIIDKIKLLKIKYGPFVAVSEIALNYMYSHVATRLLTPNCVCAGGMGMVMNTNGDQRRCVMGEDADCSRCGNWEMMHATSASLKGDIRLVHMLFNLFGVE